MRVAADSLASIRSLGSGGDRIDLADIRGRMLSHQRMHIRQAMYDPTGTYPNTTLGASGVTVFSTSSG